MFLFGRGTKPCVNGRHAGIRQCRYHFHSACDQAAKSVIDDVRAFAILLLFGCRPDEQVPESGARENDAFGASDGTGRMMVLRSAAAALSKTTNWPLRGRI